MSLFKHWGHLLFALVALGAVAALAAACGGDDDEKKATASPGAGSPTAAADQRAQGGTMTVQSNEFESLDPHYSSFAQDISLDRMLWRGLYAMDIDNLAQPMMAAAAPQVSADGKTYTIKLKSGLKWSDGDVLTAADFEAGIKRTCNPILAGTYEGVIDAVIVGCNDFFTALGTEDEPKTPTPAELKALEDAVGAKALDDTTVEFKLTAAKPTFPLILSLWLTFPVPTHLPRFASQTPDKPAAWGTDPKGLAYNGPYILTDYVQQDSVTLAPNPNWVGEIKPTLDKLIIKFIDKKDVADNAYRNGELDEADADNANLKALEQEFGDEFFKPPQPGTRGLQMELKKPPLDKLEVRLALSQAIDRVALNEVTAGGGFVPTTTWLPESLGGPPPDGFEEEIGYNPTKAKDNLTKAGFPGGAGFPKLKILTRDSPDRKAQSEFLQRNFKEILGIDVDIEVVDGPTRSARLNSHDFELAVASGWIQDYPDPENWILGLFETGGSINFQECSDPEVDALIAKAQFNTNDTERREQYKQINELITTRICGYAPYYHEAQPWLVSSKVVGMKENSSAQNASMPGDWAAEAWGFKK